MDDQNKMINNELPQEPETSEVSQDVLDAQEEAVIADAVKPNRKKAVTIIVICSICVLIALAIGALFFLKGDIFGASSLMGTSSTYQSEEEQEESSYSKTSSKKKNNKKDQSVEEEEETEVSSKQTSTVTLAQSDKPKVTIAAEVANGICIVGGSCPGDTEYVTVRGEGITETKIVPYPGDDGDRAYFIGQVKFSKTTYVKVTATEKGKGESKIDQKQVKFTDLKENYMTSGEYNPVIGLNSRSHFYSALLSYSLTTKNLTSDMRARAESNIKELVSKADAVGAETIFLVIPSSAEIYPETVPEGYPKANGETLYQAFEKIAASTGAKVIYPKDRMLSHKNDGKGYQIYQYTDSHWSTYGAYWGTYDLLQYVAQKYPAAKPRTVDEMYFYTTELNAGDVVFNLKGNGFDTDRDSGITRVTGMREFTNLYYNNIKTLDSIYHGATGLYLTWHNAAAKTLYNINPEGLPNAVIMRDSFGKVAYDMLSDRFATTCWGEFDNYTFPQGWEDTNPDYVIHLYSERNLLKLMLNDSSASILALQ